MTKAPQSFFFGNTMKIIRVKQVFYVLSLLFLSISSIAFSQGPTRRITIAVLEFEGNGVPDQTMQDVSARFATEYAAFKGSKFIIINRSQMRTILQEQGIRVYGCSTFKCGLEAGNVLGADYIVTGTLTKNGSLYSLKSQLIDIKGERTISRANYDNIVGDIVTVMSKEVKKAAAYLASAKVESEVVQKEVAEISNQKVIILPLEITLDESFEAEQLAQLVNEWIRSEVTFSEKSNLVDFSIEKTILSKEEFKSGVMSNEVAKVIGKQNDATHVITWTLRVTENKSHVILNHFNILGRPESVLKSSWLEGGLRARFQTTTDIDVLKMNIRKYTWPILGATPPTGRFPVDSFFTRIWMKIKIAIDSFLFYIENTYGIAVVILILLLLSGFGLAFGYDAIKGDDPGPGIGFPPEY
jgi:TolB-like protein